MMGGVEGPATLLDRASMGVMASPTALRLPPSQDMSGNAGRRGRAVLPPRAMPGHRAYDAVAVSAGRAAFHAAAGGGAGVAAGGRRVSRFPDGFPSPDWIGYNVLDSSMGVD